MGSRPFRLIRPDGSWPVLTVGGNIKSYERCLIEFVGAWKMADAAAEPQQDEHPMTVSARVRAAYRRGYEPRRPARLSVRS